jgi:hypothetical protein
MTESVPQTQQDLEHQFQEQIQFMELSASSFDKGFDAEAKHLAVSLRVLLHDTNHSHSLLGLLNRKYIKFYDTSFDYDPNNPLTHGGLVAMTLPASSVAPKPKYIALLDDLPMDTVPQIDFDTWWNKVVFVDRQRRSLTRKELVRTVADQDGGAHVDPALNQPYADLSRSNSLGWISSFNGILQPMDDPTRSAIRQIAHEVLKSLKEGYTKKPDLKGLIIVKDITMKITDNLQTSPLAPPKNKIAKTPRVPISVTSPIKRLCNRLVPMGHPLYVEVSSEEHAEVNDCFINVENKTKQCGGKVQYGWAIWYLPGILMEAEFYAVWLSPDGKYLDVSPHQIQLTKIMFVPDPKRVYTGKQTDNVRIPLNKDPRVKEFIQLHERKFRIMNEGDPAKQHGLVNISQDKIAPLLRRLAELSIELNEN